MATANRSNIKGKNFERKIAKKLSPIFGVKLCRSQSSGGLDIKGDIRPEMLPDGTMPYLKWVVECKNWKNRQLPPEWIKQMYLEELANEKIGMVVSHIYGTIRDVVIMREEIAEKELYPAIVDPDSFMHFKGNILDNNKKNVGNHVDFLKYAYELYGKYAMLTLPDRVKDRPEGCSGLIRVMLFETFDLLYRNNQKRAEEEFS